MFKAYRALMLLLAEAAEKGLAAQVQYLKAENQILRSKLPRRFWISPQERQRLVKLGRALGLAIRELITIVPPRTFACWVNGDGQLKRRRRSRCASQTKWRALLMTATIVSSFLAGSCALRSFNWSSYAPLLDRFGSFTLSRGASL